MCIFVPEFWVFWAERFLHSPLLSFALWSAAADQSDWSFPASGLWSFCWENNKTQTQRLQINQQCVVVVVKQNHSLRVFKTSQGDRKRVTSNFLKKQRNVHERELLVDEEECAVCEVFGRAHWRVIRQHLPLQLGEGNQRLHKQKYIKS